MDTVAVSILIAAGIALAWSFGADWLRRWGITGPVAMAAAGAVVIVLTPYTLAETLDTTTAEKVVEYILAIVLFVDALEVRGGLLGGSLSRIALRLLFIALPLSIVLGVLIGFLVLPGYSFAVLLALVCALVPIDLAPANDMMKDTRLPADVRGAINLESGYNDGIVAPVFLFALALAGAGEHGNTTEHALATAIPASLKAIAVGVVVGLICGWLFKHAEAGQWTHPAAQRIGLLAVPLVAFTSSVLWHGNGFVAAFVAGIALYVTGGDSVEHHTRLTDDVAQLTGLAVWFVFGGVAIVVIAFFVDWRVVVFSLAVLTVIRIVPVYVSLTGTSMSPRDRLLVGVLGARGIATIVFALLAFNALSEKDAELQLGAMCVTIAGSLLLHGPGARLIASRMAR